MKKFNIVLIVVDTLRQEMAEQLIGKVGLNEGLFSDALLFKNCVAPAPWTLPSHVSMITGKYPSEHGSHETKDVKSLDIAKMRIKVPTIAGALNSIGYSTYLISSNPYIHPVYGFDEFQHFTEETYFTDLQGHAIEVPKRLKPMLAKYRAKFGGNFFKIGFAMLRDDPALITEVRGLPETALLTFRNLLKKLNAKVIEGWPLEKGGKETTLKIRSQKIRKPFFYFVNLMEAHEPYIGKKGRDFDLLTPYFKKQPSEALVREWKSRYAKASAMGLRYAKQIATDLIGRFGEEETIVMITSDHGQSFAEGGDGFIGHGPCLIDEVVRVPFILKMPKYFKKIRTDGYVSHVNINNFIEAAINGDKNAAAKLVSDKVYSETFGIQSNFKDDPEVDMKRAKKYDRYQKRVFGK